MGVDALLEGVHALHEPVGGYLVCFLAEVSYLSPYGLDVGEDVAELGGWVGLAVRPGEYIHLSYLHPDEELLHGIVKKFSNNKLKNIYNLYVKLSEK